MHDAVAATEVVCDTSRKLVAKCDALQTTDSRLQGMLPVPRKQPCVLLLSTLETEEINESDESGILGNPFLWFLAAAGWEGFPSPAPSYY